MCSLKRKVNVKVTKFCIGREELIIVNKLTKFDLCIINGLCETKLNATAKRKLLTPDRQTDGFRQFIDRTCFAIRSKMKRHNQQSPWYLSYQKSDTSTLYILNNISFAPHILLMAPEDVLNYHFNLFGIDHTITTLNTNFSVAFQSFTIP